VASTGSEIDPALPQLDLNASFVKEMQIEHNSHETSENLKGECADSNKKV